MRLYLVRHGTSTGNTPGNLLGHGDHPLTQEGERQARAAARRLAPLGPMPVYCSDLPRAHQTAVHISGEWSAAAEVHDDPRLRELDLGQYHGRSWDEFLGDEELNAAMLADPVHTRLPGGESLAELRERVLQAVDDIVRRHAEPSATVHAAGDRSVPAGALLATVESPAVCLVAHDGPLRVILNHHLGVGAEKWWAITTTHGGVSLLEWSGGWVNIRFVNDTSHLSWPQDRTTRQ